MPQSSPNKSRVFKSASPIVGRIFLGSESKDFGDAEERGCREEIGAGFLLVIF